MRNMNRLITLFILLSIFSTMDAMAQSAAEKEILNLSKEKFRWKTEGKIDLIEDLFDDELVFVHITGNITTKKDWISQLRSKSFVYNKIELKEASAKMYSNTAVLVGKATFSVNGGSIYKLVYTEVYTKKNNKWKLVNLHTTSGYF
jgi:hypothetical protein